jgi:protein involved in polysaccharide export with SLBB domain
MKTLVVPLALTPDTRFSLSVVAGRTAGFLLCLLMCTRALSAQNALPQSREPSPFRPGDAIRITVPTDTSQFLQGVYRIDDSGRVFLPVIGSVVVTRTSAEDLKRYLDSAFVRYLPYPSVKVEPQIRVGFLGGFYRPGLYYLSPDAALWDALGDAGGPMRQDGFEEMRWERSGDIIKDGLTEPLERGVSLRALGVRSGDQITVTDRPLRTAWEVFRTDVLPVLALAVSTAATSLSIVAIVKED